MAGVELDLELRSETVARALGALAARAGDLSEPLGEIGATLVLSTRQRFFSEKDPEGKAWQPLKPRTQKRKVGAVGRRRGTKHILRQRRTLFNSVAHLVEDDEVAIGSPDKRAAIHQLGGTDDMAPGPAGIPARPYLGISEADEGDIAATLLRHLEGED